MMKGFSISSGSGEKGGNKTRTLILAGIVVVLGAASLVSKADRFMGRATALVTAVKELVGVEAPAPAPAPARPAAVAAAPATPAAPAATDSLKDSTTARRADSTVAQAGAPVQAGVGRAGVPGAAAKTAATKAADAASARVNAQTTEEPAVPAAKAPAAAPAAPTATPAAAATLPAASMPAARTATNPALEAAAMIHREVFSYEAEGRRDPFVSLMRTTDLRPALQDLRLTGILFDHSGQRPVAIMRETATNEQYRVTTGMTLGRMRVAEIRPKKVIFVIEEFGFSRRDSLVLVDPTTKRIP